MRVVGETLGVAGNVAATHWRNISWLQRAMRDAAHMPQLRMNAPARRVHGVRDQAPSIGLLCAVHARAPQIALPLWANLSRFAEN